jgi:hypothetical protein
MPTDPVPAVSTILKVDLAWLESETEFLPGE